MLQCFISGIFSISLETITVGYMGYTGTNFPGYSETCATVHGNYNGRVWGTLERISRGTVEHVPVRFLCLNCMDSDYARSNLAVV